MTLTFATGRLTLTTIVASCLFLAGCATSDSSLRQDGHSEAYIQGFHDGRHSGMKEAGNYLEHRVRDHSRFDNDPQYREGWVAGEAEGVRIQQEANAAAGSYSSYRIGKDARSGPDADAIGREVMKGVDPATLKSLGN